MREHHSRIGLRIALLIFFCVCAGGWAVPLRPVQAVSNAAATAPIVPGEVVVTLRSGYGVGSLSLPAGAAMFNSSPELKQIHAAVIRVPVGQEETYALELMNLKGVLSAEPNYRVTVDALPVTPNDPDWPQQYGPAHIQAPQAWSVTTGSQDVTLAIIDSGIDSSHPEFAGRLLPGYDFVDQDNTTEDQCGHGTHVAGIAAASGNNGIGIAGIAWNVKIIPIRVLDGYCTGSVAAIAEALVWAVERGARVINLSLGTAAPSNVLEAATYYSYSHGAALFAAAGNSGLASIPYPAAYSWVMAVGATDINDQRASYSSTGPALDLMAPGDDILSTTPFTNFYFHTALGASLQYGKLSGTSMAAAHASGAAALLASLPQFDTPDKIYQSLTSTARDLETPGRDNNTGYGLIQLANAMAFTPDVPPTPPPVAPSTSYALLDSRRCGNLAAYNWLDITPAHNWLPVFGNDGYTNPPIALPFPFTLGDTTYDHVTVSANGYMTFGGAGGVPDNFIIPSTIQPINILAPFWDDLNPSAGGLVYQQTLGTSPNRLYVVEWSGIPRAGYSSDESSLTFEVVLYESSQDILFQYQGLSGPASDGSSATIGLDYAGGTAGLQVSYNQPGALTPGTALLFVPYATGSTPPSNACSSFTRLVGSTGGFFDPGPFCVEIPQGSLQHSAILQIQNLTSIPTLPDTLASLGAAADIHLTFSPGPPLSPLPLVSICYHYSASDLLRAGGHPENLFLAVYDSASHSWSVLPTAANPAQGLISAIAPHLSIYAVVTGRSPQVMPVTGTDLSHQSRLPSLSLIAGGVLVLGVILLLRLWSGMRGSR